MVDVATEALDLRPCEHQAGGHFASGKDAATYVDNSGKFYKVFQDDQRGGREAGVYEAIFSDDVEVVNGYRKEDLVQLRRFVPKYFGTVVSGDRKLLALEDSCSAYRKPCVLDAKMGRSTIYEWADDYYKTKNAGKDKETTQASLGLRVTGFKVWQLEAGEYFVADRKYGKQITVESMPAALAKFGSNGVLGPRDVFLGPNGAVEKVKELLAWFESQRSLQFFAASVIIMWEGEAKKAEEANVTIRFIDFAHTFPSKGQQDENVLWGIQSLVGLLEQACELAA